MDELLALPPGRTDGERLRLRSVVRAHYAREMARGVREALLVATSMAGGLAWAAALWPSRLTPGVRWLGLAVWPAACALALGAWAVESRWRDREAADLQALAAARSTEHPTEP